MVYLCYMVHISLFCFLFSVKQFSIFDCMTSYNFLQLRIYLKNIPMLFIILRIIGSARLYVIRQEILPLLLFSFFLNKSCGSVLSTLSIWSFKMFSSYPLSMDFCFSVAKCFLYSFNFEQIVLILNPWLY